MGNPANDDSLLLQLPSVHHNSSCDGCARDAEENRMRNEFGRQNVATKRLGVI